MRGTVIRDSGKGYGFIQVLGAERDVFVHANEAGGVVPPVGTRVEFDRVESERGPRAEHVVVIDEGAADACSA